MKTLSLDLETYSSVDLGKSSVYRYVESPDFDILLLGFSADGSPVQGVFEGLAVEQRPQAIDDLGFGDAFFVFVHGVSPSGLCALLI